MTHTVAGERSWTDDWDLRNLVFVTEVTREDGRVFEVYDIQNARPFHFSVCEVTILTGQKYIADGTKCLHSIGQGRPSFDAALEHILAWEFGPSSPEAIESCDREFEAQYGYAPRRWEPADENDVPF